MPGIIARLSTFIVIGSIAAAIGLNVAVLSSCKFFIGATDGSTEDNVELGLYRFSVKDDTSIYDTSGSCENYSDWPQGEDVPETVRAAQVCAVLAPCFGLILLLLVLVNQCCCKVPCGSILMGISHTGVNVSMALVWLIVQNDVCSTLRGGCEWSDAAIYHITAHILYFSAAIFARCMPSPDKGRVDTAEAKASSGSSSEAEVTRLQQELQQQKERVQELEQENEKTKQELAAATARMSVAAEPEAARSQSSFSEDLNC